MRISVLTPDLSHNCLGRSYLLAQLLEEQYDVEIVGPELGDGIWEPLKDEYEYKSVAMNSTVVDFPLRYNSISAQISGDVVYATKPRMTSYGFGLVHSIAQNKPLILDIDDWESGFMYDDTLHPVISYLTSLPRMVGLNALHYMRLLESLSTVADAITVSNRFLQDKFGGSLVPHVRDTDVFDPTLFDTDSVRIELDLPTDRQIILFSGTPRPHKGVADLVRAVDGLDDVVLLIVGAHESNYVTQLRSIAGDNVIFKGQQPFDQLPKWIAVADIVAIPQRESSSTRGQLPAKVFDAMAMGKPVISTNVSDLPLILDGCGIIVDPSSPIELSRAISELIVNPEKQKTLGRNARARCVEKYSYDALAPELSALVDSVVRS